MSRFSACPKSLAWNVALLLILRIFVAARAGESNVIEQLNKALAPKPASWGEVRVGTASRVNPDPRTAAALQAFQQLLGPAPAAVGPLRPTASAPAPTNAIQRLKAQGRNIELFVRPGNGTVMQLRGGILEPTAPTPSGQLRAADAGAPERTARNFLRANRELLRLDDPDAELKLESEQRDEDGARHLRFSQRYKQIGLWPAGLSVHLDRDGNVTSMDGAYVPTPKVQIVPTLTAQEAAALATGAKGANVPNGTASDFELVIYSPLHQSARLAWKFKYSTDLLHSWMMLIDAEDGRVLSRVTQVLDATAPGSAKDLGGVTQNLNIWSSGGTFYMIDTTKQSFNPAFDPIKDPHGAISIFDAREVASKDLKTIFLVDSTSATTWLPDAVSALFNFSKTYDYYFQRHARNSLDGNGGNVQAVVRISQLDNAFWSGDQKMMFFGNVRPYPLALDVVGHELTHGVTQNSADLVYELQPGAMNEAFSDIFGVSVESWVNGKVNWTMGEQLGKIFRDMKNPGSIQIEGLNKPYPSKMGEFIDLPNSDDADHGGVHINSSITFQHSGIRSLEFT